MAEAEGKARPAAQGECQTRTHRGEEAEAAVLAAVAGGVLVAYGTAAVGRPVVDEDDLEMRIRLRQQAVHTLMDKLLDVVYRHDDAHDDGCTAGRDGWGHKI